MECEKYDLGGHREVIKVTANNCVMDLMLFSNYCYGDLVYLKAMKQVKVRQMDDEIHVFLIVATKIINEKPSTKEEDHFAVLEDQASRICSARRCPKGSRRTRAGVFRGYRG